MAVMSSDGQVYALVSEGQLLKALRPLGEDLAERAVLLLKRQLELAAQEQAGSPRKED